MKKYKIYILIAIFIIFNMKMYFHIVSLRQEVSNINNNINSLDRSINNISSSVSHTVNQIVEEQKWVRNIDYSIVDISKNLDSVTVKFKWSMRELSKDYKMYLLYTGKDNSNGDKWTEVAAEDLGNLNYSTQITLPYENNYKFKIIAKNNNNNISENLTEINFLESLSNRVDIQAMPREKSTSANKVNFKFEVNITSVTDLYLAPEKLGKNIKLDENLLKLKNIRVKVYSNDELKKEIEVLKDGKIIDSNARYEIEPFEVREGHKLERISYSTNLQYENALYSYEEIEVIVEDYLGRKYTKISDKM